MQPFALVAKDVNIPLATFATVAAAIQIQLTRDVAPAWNVQATCTYFPSLDEVPIGYAIVFLVQDAKGEAGQHFRPKKPEEPPFALVTANSSDATWSLAASHEIIEMLIDPSGCRLIAGRHPLDPTQAATFLMEACDPCQDPSFAYQVDHQHSALVSDFCLPSFYGLEACVAPYTFRRSVLAPFSIASGGYLSWKDSADQWFQLTSIGGPTSVAGPFPESGILGDKGLINFRGALDRRVEHYSGPVFPARVKAASRKYKSIRSQSAKARALRNRLLNQHLHQLLD